MLGPVVDERHRVVGLHDRGPASPSSRRSPSRSGALPQRDLVHRRAEPVADREPGPARRQARREAQPVRLASDARAATRRSAGTSSRPSRCTRSSRRGRCAAGRRRRRRRRRRARPCRSRCLPACARGSTGLISVSELPGALAIAQRGERHRRPDRGVRVLAAVLAHAGHVAVDVAGIEVRACRTADRAAGSARASRRTRRSSTRVHRLRARARGSPAPESTDQLCEIESIWHSALRAEPSGVPSSK